MSWTHFGHWVCEGLNWAVGSVGLSLQNQDPSGEQGVRADEFVKEVSLQGSKVFLDYT